MQRHIDEMSLNEQIGQLLMVGFPTTTASQEIIDLIQHYHVGGIILFSRNVHDTRQTLELTHSLQMAARTAGHRFPLLIAIDQENGMVRRLGQGATIFPGNMTLGAISSEEIAYNVALATGSELKALGINMNLAPVADVNNNPANPVIGVRSFGEDPQQVGRLTSAMVRGYREAGVVCSLKHFPGHGDTAVDSHLALPVVPYTMERLEQVELVPFRSGIEADADSVMVAHIYFSQLMSQEVLPATVSPAIVRGLLRERMGFGGVIVSDCMEMKAVSETIGTERATVMALQAGTDLVLVSHLYTRQRGSLEAIQAAVQADELSPQAIGEAAERVLALKARALSWESLPDPAGPIEISSSAHQQLSERAYELSTTVVRNDEALLPLRLQPDERVLTLFPRRDAFDEVGDRNYPDEFLAECIQQRHPQVSSMGVELERTGQTDDEILQAARQCDLVIMVTINANRDPRQAALMQRLVQTGRRIIGIAVYNPYDLLAFPQLHTYLVTYEYTRPALAAATRVLFGEIPACGRLPISLPGL